MKTNQLEIDLIDLEGLQSLAGGAQAEVKGCNLFNGKCAEGGCGLFNGVCGEGGGDDKGDKGDKGDTGDSGEEVGQPTNPGGN